MELVLCQGQEPNHQWTTFTGQLLFFAELCYTGQWTKYSSSVFNNFRIGHYNWLPWWTVMTTWQRYNVRFSLLSGEAAGISENSLEDWKRRLPSIVEGYSIEEVFRADETGLCYWALPWKSLAMKNISCKGIKTSKDRIKILLACSAIGGKLKPLVIGWANNPWCFKGVCIPQMPMEVQTQPKSLDDIMPISRMARQTQLQHEGQELPYPAVDW